jgi:tetratricopeptide (TPR) repeat protein
MFERLLSAALVAAVLVSGAHAAGSSTTKKRREERETTPSPSPSPTPEATTEAADPPSEEDEAEAKRKAYEEQRRRETEELSKETRTDADLYEPALDMIQDADRQAMGGDVEGATAKYLQAAAQLEKVVVAMPGNAEAWNQLGYSRRSAGKYPEALEAYQKALELQPGFAPAIEYRAEAHLALDRLDEVREAYQALFADPNHRELASTLMHAIQWYVKVKKEGEPPEGFAEFEAWATERQRLASQADAGDGGDW